VIKTLFKSNEGLKVGELKKIMGEHHSTLGSCIKRLQNEYGYVKYQPYHNVFLTKKGFELGTELNRHSRLLETLLFNELELEPEIAHKESDKFNLLFSCDTINRICEKYGHPKSCPCGEQILTSTECVCEEEH
jgi:Mn-dependent DtxR family transcriptional regulator